MTTKSFRLDKSFLTTVGDAGLLWLLMLWEQARPGSRKFRMRIGCGISVTSKASVITKIKRRLAQGIVATPDLLGAGA
jgi:hypothetical protein